MRISSLLAIKTTISTCHLWCTPLLLVYGSCLRYFASCVFSFGFEGIFEPLSPTIYVSTRDTIFATVLGNYHPRIVARNDVFHLFTSRVFSSTHCFSFLDMRSKWLKWNACLTSIL